MSRIISCRQSILRLSLGPVLHFEFSEAGKVLGIDGNEHKAVHLPVEFPSSLCDNQPSSMAQNPITSPIPPFRPDGYLPEGVHVCSEADVIFRFGSSSRRRRQLALRLRRWIELGRQVGAKRLLVDGSFVTAKEEPQDVDTVILLPQDLTRQLEQ